MQFTCGSDAHETAPRLLNKLLFPIMILLFLLFLPTLFLGLGLLFLNATKRLRGAERAA